jgi:ElaB/YqjD/DUF883 family membrane-anchored ribosome-binding protein
MNKEFLHMQKLAGLITESQYSKAIVILEDETIDEGIKDWIIKGLIVLTTLGGIGKVYQMDQAQKQDRKAQTEYYNNILSKEVTKMSEDDLFKLGADINSKTHALQYSSQMAKEPNFQENFEKAMIDYAQDYVKANPAKFAVGADGGIYQIGK